MNSIAFMSQSKSTKPEAAALAAAMNAKGIRNVDLANAVSVSPGAVSQWVQGNRPVPPAKAQIVAELVGVMPEQISAKFAEIAEQRASYDALPTPVQDVARPPLEKTITRLETDIDSLRLALGVMAAVMTAHRPAEAADVAKAMRRHLRGKYLTRGYVKELLTVLEGGTS